ncbi:MAG: glycosyltransferase family 2 protein [Thiomargarita sp.]|nr:glycosyltransferase family 2 protein [Thiomargarita sp.]
MLSVIIITKNAAKHIKNCLDSVAWADEIIIVDSGSTDDTLNICRSFTDKIFVNTDWQGFGLQKNRALNKATQEWILSIDADEQVTPALKQEIKQIINQSNCSAFLIPRRSHYCQREIKHSGWYPDYVLRLFRRDVAKFSHDLVHEKVETIGEIGTLNQALLHYPFDSLEQVLDKINHYSTANALQHYQNGKASSLKTAIFHGIWAFLRTYILQRGFLDGREGFILAISNAEGTYYRYLKLMYLQQKYVQN